MNESTHGSANAANHPNNNYQASSSPATASAPQGWGLDAMKVVVRMCDMPEKMQSFAIETAKEAKRRITSGNQDIAKKVKVDFDQNYQGNWHCIVGSDFGSFVSHESNSAIFFYIGRDAFLIWKTL